VRVVRSRLIKRTLLSALAVVAALVLLLAAAHLEIVRGRVLDWAVARASRDLGVDIEADSLRYNLLAASGELRNARVSAPGERAFFEADAIRVGLVRGELPTAVEIDRIEIDRPHLTIVRHRDGSTNLPAGRSNPTSQPTPLHLGRVALSMMSVALEDESGGNQLEIAPLDLTLDTRAGASATGSFGPTPIAASLGSSVPPQSVSGTVAGRLGFDGSRLTVHDFRLDVPEGRFALEGWVDILAQANRVDARAALDTDLARASRFISTGDVSIAGTATANVTVSGAITDPTVRITVRGPAIALGPVRSISVAANATYASGRVNVESLSATSDVGTIDVNGILALTDPPRAPRDNDFTGRIVNLDVDRLLDAFGVRRPVDLGALATGGIAARLDAAAPFDADAWRHSLVGISVRLTPTGTGLSVDGKVDAQVERGRWRVGHSLRSPAGRASLEGVLLGNLQQLDDPGTYTLSGSTRLRVEEVRTLVPVLQRAGVSLPPRIDGIDGAVDLWINPQGTVASPTVHATITGREVRVPGLADPGELDSIVAIDRRSLKADPINARLGPLRASASGEYTWLGQIAARFDATADDLGAVAAALDLADASLSGSTELKGSVRGTFPSPQGEGQLTALNLSAYGVAVGPMTARLRLEQGRLNIEAEAPDLLARASGAVDTRDPFGFHSEVNFDRSPIASMLSVPQTRHLQAEGTIAAALRANGTIARLADTAGEIEVRALDAKLAGVPIALDTRAVVSFEANALSTTPLLVRVGRETAVRLQGALSAKGALTGIDVEVESAIPDLLSLAATAFPDQPIEAVTSRVKLDLHVGGTLAAPQPSGTLALEAASLKYADIPPFADVVLGARIEPERIAFDTLTARWQGASLSAVGAIPLRMIVPPSRPGATGLASWGSTWLTSLPDEPHSATLNARVTGVTTDALATFVDRRRLDQMAVMADATLTADADRLALDAVRGTVVLDQASLDLAGVPFTQSTPTRLRLDNGRAHLEELRWNAQGNELHASGSAGLIGPVPALDLAVDGALDLRVLGAFATGIASGGLAHTALTVTGPLASPQIVGNIDVTSGELRLETPSLSASDFSGNIAVDAARRATIYLNGDLNGGPAYVEGTFALDEITSPQGRLTVKAWNVMLEYPEGFQTESNADLAFVLGPASALSGRVDVLSGLYREPLVVSQRLLAGFGGSAAPAVGAESPFLENLRLDVTIATANEIRIDNNYGRLNLTANLQATGSAAHPGVVGRLEAEPDGEVYLAGNT
jgi:autotransporter translocation and assembly factor TamB